MLAPIYLEAVQTLAKASGRQIPKGLLQGINTAHEATEPKAAKALLAALRRAKTRVRRKLSVDALAGMLGTVHKSEADDVKARLRDIVDAAFDGAAADLVAVESDLIDTLARQFATVYDVDLNYSLVSSKAVDYLEKHAECRRRDNVDPVRAL